MRDEKFDEYFFDKKKYKHFQGEENEKSEDRKYRESSKLHHGDTGTEFSDPGISDYARSESHSDATTKHNESSGTSPGRESHTKPKKWYHGSEEIPYQPNNLEADYYEQKVPTQKDLPTDDDEESSQDFESEKKDYHGIGPKGFKRQENKVYEEICEKIMNASDINAQDVEIRMDQSLVFLNGEVATKKMRDKIEEIAKYTLGVSQVINNIVVKRRN